MQQVEQCVYPWSGVQQDSMHGFVVRDPDRCGPWPSTTRNGKWAVSSGDSPLSHCVEGLPVPRSWERAVRLGGFRAGNVACWAGTSCTQSDHPEEVLLPTVQPGDAQGVLAGGSVQAPVGLYFGVSTADGHFGTPSAPYATETQFHFTVPVGEYQSIIRDRSGRIRSKHLLKL
jgi:hypothetical protein